MARRAPARRTNRRTYRRRPQNVSFHEVRTRGSRALLSSDNIFVSNLLTTPEASNYYGKDLGTRGNAVVGLRGNWWFSTSPESSIQNGFLSFALISDNVDQVAQIDTAAEQTQVGPLDLDGQYRPWHYRRIVPASSRFFPTEATGPIYDEANMILDSRQGIGARRAEKFRSVRDSYFLYLQWTGNPSVTVWWDLKFYIREP